MFPFHRAEIHARGYGSSTDLEVKASSGRLAATCRLLKPRSVFLVHVDFGDRNKPTFCLVQFAHDVLHGFYHSSQTLYRSIVAGQLKPYLERARYQLPLRSRLRLGI
jgi:hypothetical protein